MREVLKGVRIVARRNEARSDRELAVDAPGLAAAARLGVHEVNLVARACA